jgi:hypothetical protein
VIENIELHPYRCDVCGRELDRSGRCPVCAGWEYQAQAQGIDGRVYRVPVSEIGVDPGVYQFKAHVDADGVSEGSRLMGEWNEAAAGLLLLFEDVSGILWVANGHHRLSHARRCGIRALNALIVREIEGYNQGDARRLAAEANILDGKGTDVDHAEFFRDKSFSADKSYAEKKGLKRRGWVIGQWATDDLYSLFRAGRVSGECAEAVSGAAPLDVAIQTAGARWCLANPRAKNDEARAYTEALKVVPRGDAQADLFGYDDSALTAAEEMSRIVRGIRAGIAERITAVRSAAKRPEVARAEGVDVRDAGAILERVREYQATLARWEKWYLDPELTAVVKERANNKQAA